MSRTDKLLASLQLGRPRPSGSFPLLERKWFYVAEEKRDNAAVAYIPRRLKQTEV